MIICGVFVDLGYLIEVYNYPPEESPYRVCIVSELCTRFYITGSYIAMRVDRFDMFVIAMDKLGLPLKMRLVETGPDVDMMIFSRLEVKHYAKENGIKVTFI